MVTVAACTESVRLTVAGWFTNSSATTVCAAKPLLVAVMEYVPGGSCKNWSHAGAIRSALGVVCGGFVLDGDEGTRNRRATSIRHCSAQRGE